LCCAAIQLASPAGYGAEPEEKYHKAPDPIAEILEAPALPTVSLSPARDRLILAQGVRYPSISDLAEPMLRLAGARINPRSNGPHRAQYFTSLTLKGIADDKERKLALPGGSKIGMPIWAPDGKEFAFLKYNPASVELWVADAATGGLRKLKGVAINAAFGDSFQWMPDSVSILCLTVPANRPKPPVEPRVPTSRRVWGRRRRRGPTRICWRARSTRIFSSTMPPRNW
jgi:dipeptidyl aminopeptidase/acylaminoacyl peptidase